MKKFYSIILIAFLCITILTMFSSCVKTVVKDESKPDFRDNFRSKKSYKKLKDHDLVLYPVGNNIPIELDKKAKLTLRLSNFAHKKIRVNEWYMNTPDNIVLYYRPFNLRVKKFIAKNWTKLSPETEKVPLRFELILMPKNSVLITKKLDFLKDIKLKKGESKKFLILAELNLKSVKVRSSMFSIEVKQK